MFILKLKVLGINYALLCTLAAVAMYYKKIFKKKNIVQTLMRVKLIRLHRLKSISIRMKIALKSLFGVLLFLADDS